MKKQLLFITALMLASMLGAQDFNQPFVEKIKHHPQKRSAFLMNFGSIKLDMMQTLLNFEGEFVEFGRTEYDYTGQGLLQTETEYSAGETEIELDYRSRYFYQDGLLRYELDENYNTETLQWELEDSTTFTYDNGLLVREDYFWYDSFNDEMDHDEIGYYYYTGTQLDSIIVTRWNGAEYLPYEKEEFEYVDGTMTMYSYFGMEENYWLEVERITHVWENGELHEMIFQEQDEMEAVLVNIEKTVFSWEENGNLDMQTMYEWNTETELWDSVMRMDLFYNNDIAGSELVLPFYGDEEGDPSLFFTHQVDSAYMDMYDVDLGWIQGGIIKFHYSDFVGMNETELSNSSQLSVYPNPAKDWLKVNFSTEKQTSASICDNLGRIIKTVTLQNSDAIDISELNSGFYYLILTGSEHGGSMAKFIVE